MLGCYILGRLVELRCEFCDGNGGVRALMSSQDW